MALSLAKDYIVRDLMTRGVITVGGESRVREAVMTMGTHGIGSLVVVEDGDPVGIFTERDLLRCLVAGGGLMKKEISELCSHGYAEVDWSAKSHEAARSMIESKGRLLVFEGNELVGIVTATDLVNAIWRLGADFEIGGVVSRNVVTVKATSTILDAAKKMDEKKVGCVVLTRGKSSVGILTERDLLNRLLFLNRLLLPEQQAYLRSSLGEPSFEAATYPVVTGKLGLSGAEAAQAMVSRRIKRLPLTQRNKIVGIVTARDLVEAFAYPSWSSGSGWGERPRERVGEVCPICMTRIDAAGLCACGAGGD